MSKNTEKTIQTGATSTESIHLERLKNLAACNGFELLDTQWRGTQSKYQFLHIESGAHYAWLGSNLLSKGFPKDLRTKMDKFNALARRSEENGFVLLDKEWGGIAAKHRFMNVATGKTYTWVARQIMGTGFPKTYERQHGRLAELLKKAQANGFELLDDKWRGTKEKYHFKCMTTNALYAGPPCEILRRGFPKYFDFLRACEQKMDAESPALKTTRAHERDITVCTKPIECLTMHDIANLFFDDTPSAGELFQANSYSEGQAEKANLHENESNSGSSPTC